MKLNFIVTIKVMLQNMNEQIEKDNEKISVYANQQYANELIYIHILLR